MNNNNILEHKTNYLIIKDNNFIKLYSYKSLVSQYDLETKIFEDIPYTFKSINGVFCTHSPTTKRHINKFKKFINDNY